MNALRRTSIPSITVALLSALAAVPVAAAQVAAVDDALLVTAPASEWLTYGRDYAETRYSPLDQIDTGNVDRLGLAWTWDIDGRGGGSPQVTPLVAGGTMYFTAAAGVVYALDARDGSLKWKWDPALARGGSTRGVALYDGMVFVGLRDGRLVALDGETGHPVWSRQTTPPDMSVYSISGAPRVVNGKVIIGNGGAENHGVRGYVTAYDARTGDQVWRFYTVPGDPSQPFEHPELAMAAETWSGEWWKYGGGGGTAWDSFSFDPEANLLYVGTGNGQPWSHYWRSAGEGDNLFLNSILALNPDTGELVWYYQAIPAENWDYTTTMNLILADITIDGRERNVVMTANKAGFFYVVDRLTGEFISAQPVSEVNWASGYDPETGRPIETEIARYDTLGAWIAPGGTQWGGHNWHAMSFHPRTGLAYVPGQNNATFYALDPDFEPNVGGQSTGTVNRQDAPPAPVYDPVGFLAAWDPATNSERWRIPLDTPRNGGTLTTGENLLFSLKRDGWIFAHDATTGEVLWQHRIGADPAAPITFEVHGTQYVSVVTSAPGLPGRVWTFTLDGSAPSPLSQ